MWSESLKNFSAWEVQRPWSRSREGLRAFRHFPGEAVVHGEEAPHNTVVVVDEVLDAEFNPVLAAENNAEFLGHPLAGRGGQHFRVAAKLNGVIRLG